MACCRRRRSICRSVPVDPICCRRLAIRLKLIPLWVTGFACSRPRVLVALRICMVSLLIDGRCGRRNSWIVGFGVGALLALVAAARAAQQAAQQEGGDQGDRGD